jgi:TonB family protein
MYLCYQSSDENGKIKNGKYITYHSSIRDTAGYYINNRRDGVWNLYTHDLNNRLVSQLTYQTDQLISKKDSDEVKKEIAYRMDSLNRQMPGTGYEMESRFAGGDHGWQEYLLHSLHYPDEAVDNMIQGAVVIIFVVDKEGNVSDASILRSVEYSLDTESLLIINASSGRWEPAEQNGRKIKSYKKQPIVYKLQVQK